MVTFDTDLNNSGVILALGLVDFLRLADALLLAAANTVATKTLLVSIQAARQVKSSQMGRHIFIFT